MKLRDIPFRSLNTLQSCDTKKPKARSWHLYIFIGDTTIAVVRCLFLQSGYKRRSQLTVLPLHAVLNSVQHLLWDTSPFIRTVLNVFVSGLSHLLFSALSFISIGTHVSVQILVFVNSHSFGYRCRRRHRWRCWRSHHGESRCRMWGVNAVFSLEVHHQAIKHRGQLDARPLRLMFFDGKLHQLQNKTAVLLYTAVSSWLGRWNQWSRSGAPILDITNPTTDISHIRWYEKRRYIERLIVFIAKSVDGDTFTLLLYPFDRQ